MVNRLATAALLRTLGHKNVIHTQAGTQTDQGALLEVEECSSDPFDVFLPVFDVNGSIFRDERAELVGENRRRR